MENHDDINGILQQETDQELVMEPIATFDCTQKPYDVQNVAVLNFGSQLKNYCQNGNHFIFIREFFPHYMQNSFSLLHPFKSQLCLLLLLVGTS
jgi:hypothetical protein